VRKVSRLGAAFWTENGCADWKVASHFANMGTLALLAANPSGVQMGNLGQG